MTVGGGNPEADSPCSSLRRLAAAGTRAHQAAPLGGLGYLQHARRRQHARLASGLSAPSSSKLCVPVTSRGLPPVAKASFPHSPGTDGARERQENQRRCLPAAAVASPGGAAVEAEAAEGAGRQVGSPEDPGARPENEHSGRSAGRRSEPLDALSLDPEGQLPTKARFGRLAPVGHRAVAGRKDSSKGDARVRFGPRDTLRRVAS
jgi:hypothetical protein